MSEIILKGIAAAPGIVIGKAYVLDSEELVAIRRAIDPERTEEEVGRFYEALERTKEEIGRIKKNLKDEMGSEHAEIFSAHLLVLEDKVLIEEVASTIRRERLCADYVFQDVLKKYIKIFTRMDDEYLRDRVSDIADVGRRVLRNLLGRAHISLGDLAEKVIVVAYDLSPSDTALMHKQNVIGFATDIGGRTSHTAIMAKSLEIPAVVGLEKATQRIAAQDTIIVDGNTGTVIINPAEATLWHYQQQMQRITEFEHSLLAFKDMDAVTLDGKKIELAANIEMPEEVPSIIAHGAKGIGLYRTEYFYMNRADLPSEEEHYQAYRYVAECTAPNPVIIRTLDLGGDKFLSQLEVPHEMNPFMGWRAIRFCLARPDIFKTQLRAILRASACGKLRIMYPMISGIEELRQANEMLEEVKRDMRRDAVAFDEDMEVGAMIEVPSAAITCDIIAKEADFFSIGTNDLIQYSLAVDRINEKIAYLYEPAHPAILRLIKNIVDTAHKEGIWVGMCGEMAGDPAMTLILLGLGLDEFSTSSIMVPEIKKIIRAVTSIQAKEIAAGALRLSTGKEVADFARGRLKEILPDFEPLI